MLARLSAFVIWGLVAATAVFWGLRLMVRPIAAPSYVVATGDASGLRGDLTRLLGSTPISAPVAMSAPEASARFHLLGIMAPKASTEDAKAQGVALIAVDGNIPKAYAVGASLDGELVLQGVSLRTASIGQLHGTPTITLELPPPLAPATGTPGGAVSRAGVSRSVPQTSFRPPIAPQITPQFVPQYVPQQIPHEVPQPVASPQLRHDDNLPAD